MAIDNLTYGKLRNFSGIFRGSRFLLFLLFMLLCIAQAFSQVSYYVDRTSGSDGNDGRSPDRPWKTIAKVNSRSFAPGDSILLRRDQLWYEELHLSSSGVFGRPVVYSGYGTGSNPHLTAADPITNWVLVGSGVWSAPVSFLEDPINQVFLDGKRGNKVTSLVALASSGDWYWESGTLYLLSNADPGLAYPLYGVEVSTRDYGVVAYRSCSYIIIDGIDFSKGNTLTVHINYPSDHITIRNSTVSYSFMSGIYSIATDLTVDHVNLHGNGTTKLDHGLYMNSDNFLVQYCTADSNAGIGIHPTEVGVGKGGGGIVRYNICHDNGYPTSMTSYGICVWALRSGKRVYVYDNIVFNNGRYGIGVQSCEPLSSVSVFNNVIWNNNLKGGDGGGLVLVDNDPLSRIEIINNIIGQNASLEVYQVGDPAPYLLSDNLYYSRNTNAALWGGMFYKIADFAAYKTASKDVDGIYGDPKFVNPATHDFRLSAGSPCIDVGQATPTTSDFLGQAVPYGAGPDIGAFEWYPAVSLPTPPRILYPTDQAMNVPTQLRLTWDQSAAATGYQIQLSSDPSFVPMFYDQDVTDTTFVINGLEPGIRHFFHIRAFNNHGAGEFGPIYQFVTLNPQTQVAEGNRLPSKTELFQNYPNPFNPQTTLKYTLAKRGFVQLQVFNSLGQEVASLVSGWLEPGYYEQSWDASQMASGIYFLRLRTGDSSQMKKAILIH